MTGDNPRQPAARPELISLDAATRDRVTDLIATQDWHCEACGATKFAIGDALIMGFLFLDEDADAYLVALTCGNPECPKPRAGIRLRGKEFLSEEQRAAAESLRSAIT